MKIYHKVVTSCWGCPALGYDYQNCTRWECKMKDNKFICWQGSDKEDRSYFPDWCPLEDTK
jgi:hypothetical protein